MIAPRLCDEDLKDEESPNRDFRFALGTIIHYMTSTKNIINVITVDQYIASGAFGVVYKAHLNSSSDVVALKHVPDDRGYNQREAEILQMMDHCNVIRLIFNFHTEYGTPTCPPGYHLLVMDFMPMSMYNFINEYQKRGMHIPMVYVLILSYQLFRALAYVHSLHIVHRDIKPENLLMDPVTFCLKIGDFGSAKTLETGESSQAYVCTRAYRAPELFAMEQKYTTKIDMWSAGCVLAELLRVRTLFGSNKVHTEQLLHMVSVIGTAGLERAPMIQKICLDRGLTAKPFTDWDAVLGIKAPIELLNLLDQCMIYESEARIDGLRTCAHAAFNELRSMEALQSVMPNGMPLPPLFNLTKYEEQLAGPKIWLELLPVSFKANMEMIDP